MQEEGCAERQEKVKSQRETQTDKSLAVLVMEQGPKRQTVSGENFSLISETKWDLLYLRSIRFFT